MSIGAYRHVVVFENPDGPAVPDGDGGWTQPYAGLTPASWHVSIKPATARDLERVASGTVLSTATHIVTGRYHPQVNTQTRMVFGDRTFSINGVANLEERGLTMELLAVEVVT